MHLRPWQIGLIALATCSGCVEPPRQVPQELVVAHPSDSLTLDPARITDTDSARVAEQIFEPLVRYRRSSLQVEPALATHWTVSTDGKTWRFFLRKGVTFHDGTPFDADAVVFSFERQRDAKHPAHFERFTYWENSFRNIREVRKVDQFTVDITISRPFAPFLASLAMIQVSIVSPAAFRKYGRDAGQLPIGTGAFRFVRWDRGRRIMLQRNPKYWGPKAKLASLEFRVLPDPRRRLQELQNGTVHVVRGIPLKHRPLVNLHTNLLLMTRSGNNVAYMAMNTSRSPFSDRRVRHAVNYGIDQDRIVKYVYQGLGTVAHGPIPPELWSHEPGVKKYGYDPARARRLLVEAGYDFEQRLKLHVMSSARPYLPSPVLAARMIARDLAKIGMRVDLVIKPLGEHLHSLRNSEHDLCMLGWTGDNGDPDNFLSSLLGKEAARVGSAQNVAFFIDDGLQDLISQAQVGHDRKQRIRLYRDAQRLVAEAAPWVPIAHSSIVVAAQRRVKNLVVHPTSSIAYRNVSF